LNSAEDGSANAAAIRFLELDGPLRWMDEQERSCRTLPVFHGGTQMESDSFRSRGAHFSGGHGLNRKGGYCHRPFECE
jgi:hypothetical protein